MTTGHPSARTPAVRPLPGWPIRFSIASVVVLAMLMLAVAVLALGSYGSRQNTIATATHTARDAGKLVTEQARRMLEPAQATVRQLGFDPIARWYWIAGAIGALAVLGELLAPRVRHELAPR